MDHHLFTGVCTALVTPFLSGKVNYPMAQQLLRRQMESGIRSVVLSGTTGEASTLSDAEKLELIIRCRDIAGDQCLLIAGTGSNDTSDAVSLSQAAQRAGADALLVVSPYYNKANAEGLYRHYQAVARAVSLPVIVYNVPSRTGVDIPVSVYQRLSQIDNIVGVKEASTDITKIIRIRSSCPDSFSVWMGNDTHTVAGIAVGAQGVISVASNVCPQEMIAMTREALTGDRHTAAKLQWQLQPLMELLFCEVNPIAVKEALYHQGYDCGGCRLPLTAPEKQNREKLKAFFR